MVSSGTKGRLTVTEGMNSAIFNASTCVCLILGGMECERLKEHEPHSF